MALMTGKEYLESLRSMNLQVYMFGKKVENPVDDPILRPSVNSVRMTYDLATGTNPEYVELMTAVSNLTGERVNRFTHIHQSTEDLVNKVKMQRLLGQVTAACFQRCVGMDAFNAVYSTTYEIDQKHHTNYHENFRRFVTLCQEKDYTVDGAMTDPKGDRSLPPHKQDDPDMFLRVVERRPDGIVVRGAKAHQTGMCNSHHVLVMPTQAMSPEDKDYAVSFSCPCDAEGLFMIIGRQSCDTRKLEGSQIDVGNSQFGGVECLVVFDDVFIPNENIYMNGESEFATMMVERFAGYHRQSYGGCKVGVGDVLIGASAVAAEFNGVEKASHIKDKLIEMIHLNETMYACGIACSSEGTKTASGNYLINLLLANVCKQNVTRFPYEMARIAEDLAGGSVGTCLSEADLRGEFTGPWVEKYMKNGVGVSAENRMRILRLIENLSLGSGAVGYRTESLHGAGSPQAQRVMIARQGNIAGKKLLAKRIAHISEP
ncbi:MAG: 4-hydroxyphenylacetate 3-hydroxylase family protein [Clostridiales bacterium]|nr:4-hydroxyphenylacetate 3-hydroxylase family protein [Clostridiales bacterium]